ncbi:uncharacterized protein ARMOST_07585 [Armillaria ostoyae]|uniref:Uncharacterized protein n=1 Tax=Armillaria ostoyae TaxID=47428 RepID=A0A284R693_ARMOS|nr:uncharacterized protein ARMOST_07585 [Armillaria ostoyae]
MSYNPDPDAEDILNTYSLDGYTPTVPALAESDDIFQPAMPEGEDLKATVLFNVACYKKVVGWNARAHQLEAFPYPGNWLTQEQAIIPIPYMELPALNEAHPEILNPCCFCVPRNGVDQYCRTALVLMSNRSKVDNRGKPAYVCCQMVIQGTDCGYWLPLHWLFRKGGRPADCIPYLQDGKYVATFLQDDLVMMNEAIQSSDSLSAIWSKAKAFLCSTLPYYTIWNVNSKTQKAASFSVDPALTDTLFLSNTLLSFIFWDGNSNAQNSKYSSIDTAIRTSLLFLFCQTSAGHKSSSLPEAPPRIGLPRLPETIVVRG